MPTGCFHTGTSSTPASGKTILVNSGGDLQATINGADCGDTVELQAGATFAGVFTLPAKGCDENHWIMIRTSAPDLALPPEGTRITPCYAGIASLPGRPSFNCASTVNVMAKILMGAASGSGPIVFASGANHYRLVGLEITRPTGGTIIYSLANVGLTDHIVFDRVWMHGTAQDETQRGIYLGSSSYIGVVDSFFTDFHCISISGACSDAQSIMGGLGDLFMGPYKIVNNFLEASGQSILFGGGEATLSPVDIEIRRNHMFKPRIWQPGQPGYVGGKDGNPFIVKNHFELKNAQRVLFEGNVLENSWGGFSQVGYGILLTPKNQNNVCPLCQVTDVTIRYSTVSHVGGGLQIANANSDAGGSPKAGERYSVHDIVVDDISSSAYNGNGTFAQVSMGETDPLLTGVVFNHVTAFAPNTLLMIGHSGGSQMGSFAFTNNIVTAGIYPVWSTGGGTSNCAYHDVPATTIPACFAQPSFASNAIIGSSHNDGYWPLGNLFPINAAAVTFTNYNNGNGGDYHLLKSSAYKNAGTDGKDLGADIDAVNTAIEGVY